MNRQLKPCNEPGCPQLILEGYCEQHNTSKPLYDLYRQSSSSRGYNSRWRKARSTSVSEV